MSITTKKSALEPRNEESEHMEVEVAHSESLCNDLLRLESEEKIRIERAAVVRLARLRELQAKD